MPMLSVTCLALPAAAYTLKDLDKLETSAPQSETFTAPSPLVEDVPLVKCISDSEVRTFKVRYRKSKDGEPEVVSGHTTLYRYLLENGGGSVYSEVKLGPVRDVRPDAKKHPVAHPRLVWLREKSRFYAPILAVTEGLIGVIILIARRP